MKCCQKYDYKNCIVKSVIKCSTAGCNQDNLVDKTCQLSVVMGSVLLCCLKLYLGGEKCPEENTL